jgi:hypothetical protein
MFCKTFIQTGVLGSIGVRRLEELTEEGSGYSRGKKWEKKNWKEKIAEN